MTSRNPFTKRLMKQLLIAGAVAGFGAFLVILPAAAQVDLGLDYATATGLGTTDIRTTIARIINIFLGLLGIVAVCLILYAGFLWMTAAGNDEQITKAKKTMTGAVIGLIIILSAYAIVRFIFGAIQGGDQVGEGDGTNGGGGFGGGRGNIFRVDSTFPAGPGLNNRGWFKNYKIRVNFNDPISVASVDTFKPIVQKCNPRLDGDGNPAPFNAATCTDYAYDYEVSGSQVTLKPRTADTYWDGESWYYIEVKGSPTATGDVLRDMRDPARGLTCITPLPPAGQPPVQIWDMSSPASRLCKRAIAFNNEVDLVGPTVTLRRPKSPPNRCGTPLDLDSETLDLPEGGAPARVDFSLAFPADETHTAAEVTAIQAALRTADLSQPLTSVNNGSGEIANPLLTPPPKIDVTRLTAGQTYIIRAQAEDGVPNVGPVAERSFTVALPECCTNPPNVCGPVPPAPVFCGLCSCVPGGDPVCTEDNECTDDSQCKSGHCEMSCRCPSTNPTGCTAGQLCRADSECGNGTCKGYCVEFPEISDVSPPDDTLPTPLPRTSAAGAGSPVTITGTGFGSAPGEVWFMGPKVVAGDGTITYPEAKKAAPCAAGPDWWKRDDVTGEYTVSVLVPDGAKNGPVKVLAAYGGDLWDDTTTDPPPRRLENDGAIVNFLAEGKPLRPGICFASPNKGSKGSEFKIYGVGFGSTRGAVDMGGNDVNPKEPGGWSDTGKEITAIVPPIKEGQYQLAVIPQGGTPTQNNIKFSVIPPPGEETPKISELLPSKGPVKTFVTVLGSGFGSQPGQIWFVRRIPDAVGIYPKALADAPLEPAICADYWHKTYIVVKVPEKYDDGVTDVYREPHDVIVATQSGKRSEPATFTINNEILKPGMCAIYPASGPPGTSVTVAGGGFGNGPASLPPRQGDPPGTQYADGVRLPHNTVNFYKNDEDQDKAYRPIGYGSWRDKLILTWVPGERLNKSTWPQSGPVYVETTTAVGNAWSSNAIPFKVQDCNEAGGDSACEDGDVCCANGSCKPSSAECLPAARNSAYGWVFSTDTLPEMPVVQRCLSCNTGACADTTGDMQSPTPQGDDACRNATIAVSFNQEMAPASFDNNVVIEECVDAAFEDCEIVTSGFNRIFVNSVGTKTQVRYSPKDGASGYNVSPADNKGRLVPGAFYRVTLKATATSGIKDVVPPFGRYLDGDYDRRAGGNFSFWFRVRPSDADCELSTVAVAPSKYTVDHKGAPPSVPGAGTPPQSPAGFAATPVAANCNILACPGIYTIDWSLSNNGSGDPILSHPARLPASTPEMCWDQVTAAKETPPGQDAVLSSTFSRNIIPGVKICYGGGRSGSTCVTTADCLVCSGGTKNGLACSVDADCTGGGICLQSDCEEQRYVAPKTGDSDVTVKFLDPRVTSYAPNCKQACVDALIYAVFNVPMQDLAPDTMVNNFRVRQCRNDSCNPPYVRSLSVTAQPDLAADEGADRKFFLVINDPGNNNQLLPATSYRVELNGDAVDGIKSQSGVALTGLNEPGLFVWYFRTKDSATPCTVNRSEVMPSKSSFQYIGERLGLGVKAFGAPDECNPAGQQLNAWQHDWLWNVATVPSPTGVIGGFLPEPSVINLADTRKRVDTKTISVAGCTGSCLNTGSQNRRPQCGNGIIDAPWEDCDTITGSFPAWCDEDTCLFKGDSATCNDGVLAAGEACEKVAGVFPPGCKDPAINVPDRGELDGKGCIMLGSSSGQSTCGDGLVGDGEACDDGNKAANDGCGPNCLREGTLPSCMRADPGEDCVNFCGNQIDEPGEDAGCDIASGSGAANAIELAGCDPVTCLKKGNSNACAVRTDPNCCGNGTVDAAKGEQCDELTAEGKLSSKCTSRCLLAGSSFDYSPPSFCRDNNLAPASSSGEVARCEDGKPLDGKIDPFQYVQAGIPDSEDVKNGEAADLVSAKVSGMTDEAKIGKAEVKLACTCKTQGANEAAHQDYCWQLGDRQDPRLELGCDKNGCCAPAPVITDRYPAGNQENVCRNTVVRVVFDQNLDKGSVENNLQVFEQTAGAECRGVCSTDGFSPCAAATVAADCGDAAAVCNKIRFCDNRPNQTCTADADCGTGDTAKCNDRASIRFAAADNAVRDPAAPASRPSLWQRITSFFRGLFINPASAENPPSPATTNYCRVPGTIEVVDKIATFYPTYSFRPANWIRVLTKGANSPDGAAILSKNWVPLKESANAYFKTGSDICKIETISISPTSHLFSMSEDLGTGNAADAIDGDHPFTAQAYAINNGDPAQIGSTPDYSFKWNWFEQPVGTPAQTSEIVVTPASTVPKFVRNGFCEKALDGSFEYDAVGSLDCNAAVPQGSAPFCGNSRCETGGNPRTETKITCPEDCAAKAGQTPTSVVTVRKPPPAEFPRNGKRTVTVAADIYDASASYSQMTATSDVTIMLCNNPWPSRRLCGTTGVPASGVKGGGLPWDRDLAHFSTLTCAANDPVWYPFYDPATNIAFYYCRDSQQRGAEGVDLPQLNENTVIKLTYPDIPGQDILNEYLFTYVKVGNDPKASWYNDALGLRILKNPNRLNVRNWYKSKGFSGSPTAVQVDGYDALKDGRTVYISAVAKSGLSIYTNIYTLTQTDNAAPETANIFDQFQANINMNMNMTREGYCKTPGTQALANGLPVICEHDRDCRVDKRTEICVRPGATDDACQLMGPNPDFDRAFMTTPPDNRSSWICQNEKGKLIRDMKRWDDLLQARATLAAAKTAEGWPRLEAGTFLRARTNTAWPSWDNVLETETKTTLPTDPINAFMECKSAGKVFDLSTCWASASKVYQCPAGSHVYEYQSVGGTDFRLLADFEVKNSGACQGVTTYSACNSAVPAGSCTWNGNMCQTRPAGGQWGCYPTIQPGMTSCHQGGVCCANNWWHCRAPAGPAGNFCIDPRTNAWTATPCSSPGTGAGCGSCQVNNSMNWAGGKTCIELNNADCALDSRCKLTPLDGCQYATGGVLKIGGINQTANNCQDNALIGEGGVCGDGVVQKSGLGSTSCTGGRTACEAIVGCYWDGAACKSGEQCEPVSAPDVIACRASNYCSKMQNVSCGSTVIDPTGANTTVTTDCMVNGIDQGPCVSIGSTRNGTAQRSCRDNCTWNAWNRCQVGFCGDGVKQTDEVCDDGAKASGGYNGDYGYCATNCQGYANRCGDGTKQPTEACDCGDSNGAYQKNGVVAPLNAVCSSTNAPTQPNVNSCSWDCRGPGPRCGDGLINGSEQCDGGMQEAKGFCTDTAKSPCSENRDCPTGFTCGNQVGVDPACIMPEQRWQRYCGSNDPANPSVAACAWGTWKCTMPGTCGDGTQNTGEACDDGNAENTDACVSGKDFTGDGIVDCRAATCGDGFVWAGQEQCDEGGSNGTPCVPAYGVACNYCTSGCKLGTVSAGFCGDNKVQSSSSNPPGPEECDGPLGLTDWVCKSTTTADQNWGKQTGIAHCTRNDCRRFCLDTSSVACYNAGSDALATNFDRHRTAAASGDSAPTAYTTPRVPAGWLGWKDGYCTDNDKTPCLSGANCPTGHTCTLTQQDKPTVLSDACDPDVDNDGVPATVDCNDRNAAVHPAWPSAGVSAAIDICNGFIDDDCNGIADNTFNVSGRILDATKQTVTGIVGAKLVLKCNNIERASTVTTTGGNYTLTFVDADGACVTHGIVVSGANNSVACADPADAQTVTVAAGDYCVNKTLPDVFTVPRPAAGGIYTIQWGQPPNDLDFHVRTSAAQHVFYSASNIGEMSLDRDITGGRGPETITISAFTANKSYKFYVHNYSQRSGPTADWGGAANVALTKFRGYSTTCAVRTYMLPTPPAGNANMWWNIVTVRNGSFINALNRLEAAEPANP